jgi:hypothetical protein
VYVCICMCVCVYIYTYIPEGVWGVCVCVCVCVVLVECQGWDGWWSWLKGMPWSPRPVHRCCNFCVGCCCCGKEGVGCGWLTDWSIDRFVDLYICTSQHTHTHNHIYIHTQTHNIGRSLHAYDEIKEQKSTHIDQNILNTICFEIIYIIYIISFEKRTYRRRGRACNPIRSW